MKNYLKNKRMEKGLTQSQLAKIVGVGRVSITRYETGKDIPPMRKAIKIAKVLGCTLDELFGVEEGEAEG